MPNSLRCTDRIGTAWPQHCRLHYASLFLKLLLITAQQPARNPEPRTQPSSRPGPPAHITHTGQEPAASAARLLHPSGRLPLSRLALVNADAVLTAYAMK
ncbi:hypothetical protein SKAU_G00045430 [Synaphobranchus kaupii]|uniref:Uncharacterized protein n=1 Tax=Synaphobranchus kaupii TaxID=118154 RepID=A0A9Q1G2T6_SYNKA|nr:hypothetical protein SKAU_G00045430 [Synaphobranchus kaupii]